VRAAKRMSSDSRNSEPPPRAIPAIAPIDTLDMQRSRSSSARNGPISVSGSGLRSGKVKIQLTSACAMKKSGSALWKTITCTSGSSSSSGTSRPRSRNSARSNRLIGG